MLSPAHRAGTYSATSARRQSKTTITLIKMLQVPEASILPGLHPSVALCTIMSKSDMNEKLRKQKQKLGQRRWRQIQVSLMMHECCKHAGGVLTFI